MNGKFYTTHTYLASILASLLMVIITIAGNAIVFSAYAGKSMNDVVYRLVLTLSNIICIILAVIITRKHDWHLSEIGFCSVIKDSPRKVLFFIPMLIDVLFVPVCAGLNKSLSPQLIIVTFIFTITVGFTEEMYFRGIVFKNLSTKGIKKAILISSLIFGIVHLSTALRGDSFMVVFMRICFAFMFGIVCAEVIYITKSIWSVVVFHCLHDFMAYISNETIRFSIGSLPQSSMLFLCELIEFLILAVYGLYLWKHISSDTLEFGNQRIVNSYSLFTTL